MDQLFALYVAAAQTLASFLFLVFIVALIKKNNSVMDVAWGIGFILVMAVAYTRLPVVHVVQQIVALLVLLWGVRLAFRIGRRNWGRSEDFRYAKWRSEWGKIFVVRSFLQIYVLQGILLLMVAAPICVAFVSANAAINIFHIIGILIWLAGYYFEVRGDYELDQFKSDPNNKGKLLMTGLWSYTRHPNYFGEATMWWGIAVIVFGSTGFSLLWLFALVGPIVITTLLLKVSGVPMVESAMQQHPDFPLYRSKTNMFIPWFPKRKSLLSK